MTAVKEWTEPLRRRCFTLCAVRLGLLLALFLLEFHVPIMHHSSCQLVDARLLFNGETKNVNSFLSHVNKMSLLFIFLFSSFFFVACFENYLWHGVSSNFCDTYIGGHQFFGIIYAFYCHLPLADEGKVIWIGGNEKHICKVQMYVSLHWIKFPETANFQKAI